MFDDASRPHIHERDIVLDTLSQQQCRVIDRPVPRLGRFGKSSPFLAISAAVKSGIFMACLASLNRQLLVASGRELSC